MNSVVMECEYCKKTVEFEIIDIREGEDCWMVVITRCPECGVISEIKMNC
jgi:uncharacterized Zn finger protein